MIIILKARRVLIQKKFREVLPSNNNSAWTLSKIPSKSLPNRMCYAEQIQVPKFNRESVLHSVHPNYVSTQIPRDWKLNSAIHCELQDQFGREFWVFEDLSSVPSDWDRPLGALMKSKSMPEGYSIWKVMVF